MSRPVLSAVVLTPGIPLTAKMVLCVFAEHARYPDGSKSFPSWKKIAREAGMGKTDTDPDKDPGKRTAGKWVAWLEAEGYIMPDAYDGGRTYDGGGRGRAVEYRVVTERLHHVEGLEYRDRNHAPHAPFSKKNHARSAPFTDENHARDSQKGAPIAINHARNAVNHAPRAPQSGSESGSESKRENQIVRTHATNTNGATPPQSISLSHASHDDTRETPEESEAIHALCAALKTCCDTPLDGELPTITYARNIHQKGGTAADVPTRARAYHATYTEKIPMRPRSLDKHWDALGPKKTPASNTASTTERGVWNRIPRALTDEEKERIEKTISRLSSAEGA